MSFQSQLADITFHHLRRLPTNVELPCHVDVTLASAVSYGRATVSSIVSPTLRSIAEQYPSHHEPYRQFLELHSDNIKPVLLTVQIGRNKHVTVVGIPEPRR